MARDSDTETFIALKCGIDNWRWAGVPFYCRTGKRMAEGLRIISIAFKEAPKSMFPADRGSARPVRTILLSILLTRPKSLSRSTASDPDQA